MKYMYRLAGLFPVLALAVFASSGALAQKVFYAEFPDVIPTGVSTFQVKFFNATPPEVPGNSTINSIRIDPPADVRIISVSIGSMSPALPVSGQAVIVNNIPGIRVNRGLSFNVTVDNTATSCAQGTWDADANTGNAYPQGTEFDEIDSKMKEVSGVGCDGVLKCPSLPVSSPGIYNFTQTNGGNTTTGLRWENKDASACIPVVFDLTFSNSGKTLLVQWDEGTQPYAVLETTTTWPPELIDPATSLPHRTKVAWDLTPSPVEIPAPACLSSNPPAPYGTLTAPITGLPASFQITAASLPAVPFAIVVPSSTAGTDPERILVKTMSGPVSGVFTVTDFVRGSGGTAISDHAAGAAVVSTPLPVIDANAKLPIGSATPHPYAGQQAKACLIEESFETHPFNPPNGAATCPPQAAGAEPLSCVLVKSIFFLIGDPIITRNY